MASAQKPNPRQRKKTPDQPDLGSDGALIEGSHRGPGALFSDPNPMSLGEAALSPDTLHWLARCGPTKLLSIPRALNSHSVLHLWRTQLCPDAKRNKNKQQTNSNPLWCGSHCRRVGLALSASHLHPNADTQARAWLCLYYQCRGRRPRV